MGAETASACVPRPRPGQQRGDETGAPRTERWNSDALGVGGLQLGEGVHHLQEPVGPPHVHTKPTDHELAKGRQTQNTTASHVKSRLCFLRTFHLMPKGCTLGTIEGCGIKETRSPNAGLKSLCSLAVRGREGGP